MGQGIIQIRIKDGDVVNNIQLRELNSGEMAHLLAQLELAKEKLINGYKKLNIIKDEN